MQKTPKTCGVSVQVICVADNNPTHPPPMSVPQALKGEVQTLARVLDGNGTSLSSLTTDSLTDVKRLTEQAARCETAIHALDGLCQVNAAEQQTYLMLPIKQARVDSVSSLSLVDTRAPLKT